MCYIYYITEGNWTTPEHFACENDEMEFECGKGEVLQITAAVWGRTVHSFMHYETAYSLSTPQFVGFSNIPSLLA